MNEGLSGIKRRINLADTKTPPMMKAVDYPEFGERS